MARPRQVSDPSILAAARACFLEHGPSVSTSTIAGLAGTSQAVLFQRFGTKEGLMKAALVPSGPPPWLEAVETGPDARAVDAQLRAMAEQIYHYFAQLLPGLAVLRSAGLSIEHLKEEGEPPPLRSERAVTEWLERAAAQGRIRPHNCQHTASIFLGALHIRPFQHHLLGRAFSTNDDRAFLDSLARMIWNHVRPDQDSRCP